MIVGSYGMVPAMLHRVHSGFCAMDEAGARAREKGGGGPCLPPPFT
jgi:hypothetical protein